MLPSICLENIQIDSLYYSQNKWIEKISTTKNAVFVKLKSASSTYEIFEIAPYMA